MFALNDDFYHKKRQVKKNNKKIILNCSFVRMNRLQMCNTIPKYFYKTASICTIFLLSLAVLISPQVPQLGLYAQTGTEFRITNGESVSGSVLKNDIPANVKLANVLVKCRVSHYAYANPATGSTSTLHMFFGNTSAGALSSPSTVINSGGQSCDGGVLDKSAYWLPAVYNEENKLTIPSQVQMSFRAHQDIEQIQEMPSALVSVATLSGPGCVENNNRCSSALGYNGKLRMKAQFANCLSVSSGDNPVLSSVDQSHGLYTSGSCPESHPYRIPSAVMEVEYPINPNSDWKLSTDVTSTGGSLTKGSTLKAYMISGWSQRGKSLLQECHQEKRNCSLGSSTTQTQYIDGEKIYSGSTYVGDPYILGDVPPRPGLVLPAPENDPVTNETPTSTSPQKQVDPQEDQDNQTDTVTSEEKDAVDSTEDQVVEEKNVAVVITPVKGEKPIEKIITKPVKDAAEDIAKRVLSAIPTSRKKGVLTENNTESSVDADDQSELENEQEEVEDDREEESVSDQKDLTLDISAEELEDVDEPVAQRYNPFLRFSNKKKKEFVYEVKNDQVIVVEEEAPEEVSERDKPKKKRVSAVLEYISEAIVTFI